MTRASILLRQSGSTGSTRPLRQMLPGYQPNTFETHIKTLSLYKSGLRIPAQSGYALVIHAVLLFYTVLYIYPVSVSEHSHHVNVYLYSCFVISRTYV